MEQSPKAGRPPGKPYPTKKLIRLKAEDAEDLKELARVWRTTEAEAMRRALREVARLVRERGAE
jgi:hypothetical protein